MTDLVNEMKREWKMGDTEHKVRLAIGSAAAAAAVFAPISYKWKGVLVAVAADTILTAIWGQSPIRRALCS